MLRRLALAGYLTTFLGTLLVAGDWWFEAYLASMDDLRRRSNGTRWTNRPPRLPTTPRRLDQDLAAARAEFGVDGLDARTRQGRVRSRGWLRASIVE